MYPETPEQPFFRHPLCVHPSFKLSWLHGAAGGPLPELGLPVGLKRPSQLLGSDHIVCGHSHSIGGQRLRVSLFLQSDMRAIGTIFNR